VALLEPFFLRPRYGVLLPSVTATLLCAGLAAYCTLQFKHLWGLSLSADHPIPVDVPGRRTLTLRSLPEVRGARLVLRGPHGDPSPRAIPAAGLHARFRGHDDHVCSSCYGFAESACVLDESEPDIAPEGEPIEVEYEVNDETRPLLDGAHLEVTIPCFLRNDFAMGAGLSAALTAVLYGAAIVGALGLVTLGVKWRLARPETAQGARPAVP